MTQIAPDAFEGSDELVIYCTKDSYALRYAIENGISYVITDAELVTYIRGDCDGDGDVLIVDVTLIQRVLVDMIPRYFDERAADVDDNGPDISDATMIQRYLAEINDPYHIGELVCIYV